MSILPLPNQPLSVFLKTLSRVDGWVSRYHNARYGKVHYYDSKPNDNGPICLLIHGIGSSGLSFLPLGELLKQHSRVIIPDLLCFSGFSKSNQFQHTLQEHVSTIESLIAQFKGRDIYLCGLSLGGWISLELCRKLPGRFQSCVLLNSAGLEVTPVAVRKKFEQPWSAFKENAHKIIKRIPGNHISFIRHINYYEIYRIISHERVKAFLKLIDGEDFLNHKLQDVNTPTLILWGEDDDFLETQLPYLFHKLLPQSKLEFISDCAHVLPLEAPDTVYERMCYFYGWSEVNGIWKRAFNTLWPSPKPRYRIYREESIFEEENRNYG